MKLNCLSLLLFCVVVTSLAADFSITALDVKAKINIDGQLTERAWQNAPEFMAFVPLANAGVVRRKTTVKMLYTPQGVVIGFKCFIPEGEIIAEPGELDHMNSYRGEGVEVMLDSAATSEEFVHVIVNAANCGYDEHREQGGYIASKVWNSDFKHATARYPEYWTAEILLPYTCMDFAAGVNRTAWRVNFARHSVAKDGNDDYSVATPKGTVNTSADFLQVNAPKMDFDAYMLAVAPPAFKGKITADGVVGRITSNIVNKGNVSQRLTITAKLTSPSGKVRLKNQDVTIEPGAEQKLDFLLPAMDENGICQGSIVIKNASSGKVVSSTRFPCEVSYVPISIELIDPHYRKAIFATQKLDKVRCKVSADATGTKAVKMRVGIRQVADKKVVLSLDGKISDGQSFEFPVEKLPETKLELFVELLEENGQVAADAFESFRKLPYHKGEIFIGKDDIVYRDGKRFFPLACWNDEYNTADYNVNMMQDSPSELVFLDTNVIPNWRNRIYNALKDTQMVTAEQEEIMRQFAREHKDNPRAFAYFAIDEPYYCCTVECAVALTAPLRDEDPYHPVAFGSVPSYHAAGEVFATHPYPYVRIGQPFSNFKLFLAKMDENRRNYYKPGQYVDMFLHQGFNYGDYGRRNERIPSYEEFRSQNFLMLILGCRGLWHYNRTTLQYPELYIGMKHLRKEQLIVGQNLVIQDKPESEPKAGNANLRILARRHSENGHYWMMICNAQDEPCKAKIEFTDVANQPMQVLSESRKITPANGVFTDEFTPWEVHVYTTDMTDFGLTDRKAIVDAIEKEYAKRVKKGNLAYQRFENEAVAVSSSSNMNANDGVDNQLWHLTDGVCDGKPILNHGFADGVCVFQDNTANAVPDWIQFKFKKPVKVGRVLIYPVNDSVKSFSIQVMKGGALETVATVDNASGTVISAEFPQVETDTVRCTVTENRGPHTILYEMEVYEK